MKNEEGMRKSGKQQGGSEEDRMRNEEGRRKSGKQHREEGKR
jgi:hypothetical protein